MIKAHFKTYLLFKGKKMTKETFKVAGMTTNNGNTKVRYTDDMVRRIKQFTKGGHTRVDFVELPSDMTKIEALNYLALHADFQSPADQATISDTLADKTKELTKGTVKVKMAQAVTSRAVKSAKPSIDAIKARGKKVKVSAEDILTVVTE